MKEAPFFTVITPVYNREEIVVETILSVLNQQFSDFEYLLIDDSSADNSLEVLEAFAKQDSRIKVIPLEENKGRCYARNKGLELANGKWICYLDSDDLYYRDHLSTMHQLIIDQPKLSAFAVDQHINGSLKKYRRSKLHQNNILLDINDFIEDNPLTANQLCHSAKIEAKWSDERIPISEDWLFLRNVALNYPIFKRAKVTNNLRDHDDRSMNTVDAKSFVENNLKAAGKFVKENNLPKTVALRIEVYTNLLCANVYLTSRMKKEAFQLIKKCLGNFITYKYALFYKALLKFII